MTWLWRQGIPHLATSKQAHGTLSLITGYKLTPEVIPRIEPNSGFRTLSVHITPSGSQTLQAQVLR
jgi:hypothetical protein